jgi:hypothetical protein
MLGGLSLHTPGSGALDSHLDNYLFVTIAGVSAAVYFGAVWLVLHRPPPRGTVWVVLAVAAIMRAVLIPVSPFLSSDINRYVWDGMVQNAGINPYRYIPADPALAPLRDQAVFPHINRANYAPTIYPPAAQVIFAITARVWPTVTGMKSVMVGCEVLAVLCLLRLLAAAGLPPERILIYAWNPLPLWAFAGNGHIDAAAAGFLALALLLRVRHRDGWAGVALGAAVATKMLPLVAGPALWRRGGGWRLVAAGAVTVIALYIPYLGIGWKVFGFLGGYGAEEGLDNGSGLWLLAGLRHLGPLPGFAVPLYGVLVMASLAGLAAWIAFIRRPDDAVAICGSAGVLMAATSFALSLHYPWYFGWLAVPAVLAPYRVVVWLSAAPVLLYLDPPGDRWFTWPSVVFVPAILLALADLRSARLLPRLKETPDVNNHAV